MKTGLRAAGFSLIELMIVVAIIALLSVFAYPQYERYILRGNRADGQGYLLDLAQRQEQFLLDQRQYSAAVTGVNSLNLPVSGKLADLYTVTLCENVTCPIAWAGGRPAFQAVLTPIPGRRQANDIIDGFGAGSGRLFINSRSERWRESDAGCSVDTCTFTAGTDKRFDEN